MEIKTRKCHIYVRRFVRYMSSNELENLMSQLNVNSRLDTHVDNLGIIGPIGTTRGKWSYADEKTHYRYGREREHELKDELLLRPYTPPIYYVPKFYEFVIDDKGRRYETFDVKKNKDGSIDFTQLNAEQLKIMFWYEHWKRKSITDAYFRLKQNIEINKSVNQIRNGGKNRNNRPIRIAGITAPRQQNKSAPKSGTAKAKPAGSKP
jgi:hypothetical protein